MGEGNTSKRASDGKRLMMQPQAGLQLERKLVRVLLKKRPDSQPSVAMAPQKRDSGAGREVKWRLLLLARVSLQRYI